MSCSSCLGDGGGCATCTSNCKIKDKVDSNSDWGQLLLKLGDQFGMDLDLNGVLFLIGIREMGFSLEQFSREEKLNLIRLGSCTILSREGLLIKHGADRDGWPIFTPVKVDKEPDSAKLNSILIDGVCSYFSAIGL